MRILAHQRAIGHAIRAPDLVYRRTIERHIQCRPQILKRIIDGDRLGKNCHPAWCDHDRETLHEGANHLKRETARSEDNRCSELDDGHARLPQYLPDLLAAAQMRRKLDRSVSQASEIDDSPDSLSARRAGETFGGAAICLLKALRCSHGVHKIIRRMHAVHRLPERFRIQQIPGNHLSLRGNAAAKKFRAPDKAAHRMSFGFEQFEKPSTDVPGGAGQ